MATNGDKLSSHPLRIKPSREELLCSRFSWKNLQIATRALHRDGLIILEHVLDDKSIDSLNAKMITDAEYLRSLGDMGPFNYNKSNIQQDPPLTQKHFNPSIFLNPLVTQITASVLGPRPRLSFIPGNSAVPPPPGTSPQRQPIHTDADFDHPLCPFALVINVPLTSMDVENGSTEVWLGTHRNTSLADQEGMHGDRASGRIKAELLKARRAVRPPLQPTVNKGSIIIRDLRLWHCGCPNYTQEPTVMLAMIHFAQWYRNSMVVEFSEDLKPTLEAFGSDLRIHSTFFPDEDITKRYLDRPFGNAYDFNQAERLEDLF